MLIRENHDIFGRDWQFPTCSEDTSNCKFAVLEPQTVKHNQKHTTTTCRKSFKT